MFPDFWGSISVILLILAHLTLNLLIMVHFCIVLILSVDTVKHVVALLAVLLGVSLLEPFLSAIILPFGLVYSVPMWWPVDDASASLLLLLLGLR
jgi:hypothetical protein